MALDSTSGWVKEVNETLQSSIQRRDSTKAQVLVLYWDDGEEGFKEEARAVRALFEQVFHYPVSQFAIPTTNSYFALLAAVTKALALAHNQAGTSLFIIHYGGHGDRDDDKHKGEERRAVWAAHPSGEPTVKWYEIQKIVIEADADILLLLDCCYAGQASRDRHGSTSRFEILAAAPMGAQTWSYGERSFTTALIRETRTAVSQNGYVVIKDLHSTLTKAHQNLFAQPIYTSLKPGHPLRLEPLPLAGLSTSVPGHDMIAGRSFLQLLIQIKDQVTRENVKPISQWLTADVPRIVSRLDIFDRTEHVQKIMEHLQRGDMGFLKFDTSAKDETLEGWDRIVTLLHEFPLQTSAGETGKEVHTNTRGTDFLMNLERESTNVVHLLERSILTSFGIEDPDTIEEALEDSSIQALGMVNQLNMRRIVNAANEPELDGPDLPPSDYRADQSVPVIQEIKVYGRYVDPEQIKTRLSLLARLLAAPKDTEFRSLKCLGWSHQEFEERFTFDFAVPPGVDGQRYETLHSIILKATGLRRPSLNERLRMALLLARAVEKWHLVGWLHQGISSPNIIFFFKNDHGLIDYSRPYLHGFEFARPDTDPSLGVAADNADLNIYRHPQRQGAAMQGHRKKHDFYSLGVVLLEVGLWQTAKEIIKKIRTSRPSPREIQIELQKNCSERLAHYAGDTYQAVVDVCLGSKFGVDVDDEQGSRLLKEFHDKVVLELAKGVVL